MNVQELIDAINQQWEERLDKIRAEIEQLPFYVAKFADGDLETHVDVERVLQIIDKYREADKE